MTLELEEQNKQLTKCNLTKDQEVKESGETTEAAHTPCQSARIQVKHHSWFQLPVTVSSGKQWVMA